MEDHNEQLEQDLLLVIPNFNEIEKLTIVNIGTPKVDYDSLGPTVGSILEELLEENEELKSFVEIIGTVEDSANALTVEKKTEHLVDSNINNFVLAIDAAVTYKPGDLFRRYIRSTGIKPGAGVKKDLREVGDISIMVPTILRDEILDLLDFDYDEYIYKANYAEVSLIAEQLALTVYSVLNKKLDLFYRDIEEDYYV